MDSINFPKNDSNVQPVTRSVPFLIDLNETPLSSPRENLAGDDVVQVPAKDGGSSGALRCGSCGKGAEVEGDMLVCCECGRGFHMRCLGTKEHQREWKCFKCLLRNGSERSRGGGVGLLDINAPPPREVDGDGEGVFVDVESFEHGDFAREGERNSGK